MKSRLKPVCSSIWRPFNVRAIMREQNNIPFTTKPIKADYMWRDIERRARLYKLPVKVPAPYPLQMFDLANRVAIVGKREGWCADYVRATYRAMVCGGSGSRQRSEPIGVPERDLSRQGPCI